MRRGFVVVCLAGCGFEVSAPSAVDAPSDDVPATNDASLDDGLVAHYRMDQLVAAVEDASGNGHVGTCSSCPAVVPGKLGAAFDFSNDRIDVAETPKLVTSAAFTVTAWIHFDTVPGGGYSCPISKGRIGGIFNTWQICYEASSQRWFFGSQGATFDGLTATPGPTLDIWHHVAIRWTGSVKEIWVDGAMRAMRAHSGIMFDGTPITIGADVDNGSTTHFFDGYLDDVRIYNRALSTDELTTLAN